MFSLDQLRGRTTLPSLDGVRGLAFLLVFASHYSNRVDGFDLRGAGNLGVWLFFVLSAFLLTLPFLERPERARSSRAWLDYAVRRGLRIMPLYVVVLSIDLALRARIEAPEAWLAHVTLQAGSGHYWAIPVEMRFYLVLPIVVLALAAGRRAHPLVVLAGLAVLGVAHQAAVVAFPGVAGEESLLLHLPVFLAGVLAAALYGGGSTAAASKPVTYAYGLLACAVLGGVLLSTTDRLAAALPEGPEAFYEQRLDVVSSSSGIAFGAAWAAFVVALIRGPAVIRRPFESPLLRMLGAVSYPAYLIHIMVLNKATGLVRQASPWHFLVILGVTLVLAACLHLLVERPCMSVRFRHARGGVHAAGAGPWNGVRDRLARLIGRISA